MRMYSPFFQTLHDETGPSGHIGRGSHSSVLRATVFHDAVQKPLATARFHDFAVIWDEDHDGRVIYMIEAIYQNGLLPALAFVGERKGMFFAVLAVDGPPAWRDQIQQGVEALTQVGIDGDTWPAHVTARGEETGIIQDKTENAALYLANLQMLWRLGSKPATVARLGPSSTDYDGELPIVVHGFKKWNQAAGGYDISPTKRTADDIARIKGEVIADTAETIMPSQLDAYGRYDPAAQD